MGCIWSKLIHFDGFEYTDDSLNVGWQHQGQSMSTGRKCEQSPYQVAPSNRTDPFPSRCRAIIQPPPPTTDSSKKAFTEVGRLCQQHNNKRRHRRRRRLFIDQPLIGWHDKRHSFNCRQFNITDVPSDFVTIHENVSGAHDYDDVDDNQRTSNWHDAERVVHDDN